ncbi:MAG TPA: prolyl oligopeptidase family serine peptidase [Vicinamibacterales bacterium]|nr:prolyl oligopeptidase family serine peptidase [Vicinamibacterales bacterium]
MLIALRLAWIILIVAAHAAPASAQAAAPLTLEQVATRPSIIGTPPTSPAWSPDSSRLVFAWNNSGLAFRDLWIASADGSGLRRLTELERSHPSPAPPAGRTTAALAAQAAARARGGVSEYLWLPDARTILFTAGGATYRGSADGGSPARLDLGGGASNLAVSPNGTTLAFLREGDLWLWRLDGSAAPARLTQLAVPGIARVPLGSYNRADVEIGTGVWGASWSPFAWAPDGRTIAFHQVDRRHIRRVPFPSYLGDETVVSELRRGYPGDENERRTLHVIDVATRQVRPIPLDEPGHRAISDFQWAPDGRLMIDRVSDTGTDRWLSVLDAGATTPRLLWHDHRATRIYPSYSARWHPDGRRIVVLADLVERDHLYAIDAGAAKAVPQAITSGPWDVIDLVDIAADGTLTFTSTQKNPYERQVYRQGPRDAAPIALTSLAGTHAPVVSPDGRQLASVWADDVTPPELLTMATSGAAREQRITTSPLPEFSRHQWARARYATFTNKVDGNVVHARIIEPPSLDKSRRHPVIFGPVYSNTVRNRWNGFAGTLQQYLVQRGYIVVQVDVRGSVGYGRAFREAFLMDYGGKDLDDLQAAVDGLKALPYVDGRRVGIWGSSYGGLLSVYALLKRPGVYAAGVAGAPAVDPHAFGPDDVAITRTPASHPDAFVRGSALQLGDDLRDPLLIIHGLMDDVVPFRTTMALAERLMLLGKDFDVATAPAATHAWTAREHYALYFYRKLVAFFDRHLAEKP